MQLSPSGVALIDKSGEMAVRKVYSGGDHCFVSTMEITKNLESADCRIYKLAHNRRTKQKLPITRFSEHSPKSQIISFSVDLAETCASLSQQDTVDLDLMTVIETLFRSQACMNASFLHENMGNLCCTSRYPGVNVGLAEQAFHLIQNLENESLKEVVSESHAITFFDLFLMHSHSDLGRNNDRSYRIAHILASRR